MAETRLHLVPLTARPATSGDLRSLPFPQAAAGWLETRKPYLSANTYRDYSQHIKTLSLFFGELKLTEIYGDNLRAYQRMRMGRVCPVRVNQECSLVQQMLK